ncbi:carboxylate-amine ligase [Rhodohalobacter sp. 8-1]|uniref:carboxylate-amine ligase n=1 Tax=Rhodohalobacter sp. 8-1 TaxID=3131972 RepID=UPI0030EDB058
MSINIIDKRPLHLFDGYGVEMEYMIVDQTTLDLAPASDRILTEANGQIVNEVLKGAMAWSNELVLHVIEVKTNGPVSDLHGLGAEFQRQITDIETRLDSMNLRLMPGAIHPWMDPFTEVKLWPHEYNPIYEAYNRIFVCRGHGWANLQSTHLNLPFHGDDEFEKLHAALRLILPLIPAMAASSPIADGEIKPLLDYRMEMYRTNSLKIPSITGLIIPEQVFSHDDYQTKIFDTMYHDIAPFDPDRILQDEWLNSRGAMSRWDRGAIEVRVMDIQEHPGADIAILEWIVNLAKHLVSGGFCSLDEQKSWHERDLYDLLLGTMKNGGQALINNPEYIRMFGIKKKKMTAGQLCMYIFEELQTEYTFSSESADALQLIFDEGPLGRRILNAFPEPINQKQLYAVYEQLCDCLRDGKLFVP